MRIPTSTEELRGGEVERYRKDLLRRGAAFAERLSELLAGQDATLADLPLVGQSGETPEDRLRRLLALVDEALHRIALQTYGRCTNCNRPLPRAALDLAPWTERCAECDHPLQHGSPPEETAGVERWQ